MMSSRLVTTRISKLGAIQGGEHLSIARTFEELALESTMVHALRASSWRYLHAGCRASSLFAATCWRCSPGQVWGLGFGRLEIWQTLHLVVEATGVEAISGKAQMILHCATPNKNPKARARK